MDHPQDRDGGAKTIRLKETARKNKRGDGPGSLAPYAAAVINDPSLLPIPISPPMTGCIPVHPACEKTSGALMPTTFVDTRGLVPNLVSRDDIVRVVATNRALAEEEMRVLGMDELSRKGVEARAVTDGDQESSPTHRKGYRPSLPEARRTRGKRPSHSAARDVEIRHGKRPAPIGVNEPGQTSRGRKHEPSLIWTAARLLQEPRPDPHPALGPILLRSDRSGGDMHPKPFFHTIAQSTDGCTSTYTARPETIARDRPRPKLERCTITEEITDANSRWAEARKMAGNPSDSSPSLSWAESSPSHKTIAATATSTENNPLIRCNATGLGSFHGEQIGGDCERHRASRALQKAGAELRALTAAGTTGRRNPPPREVRVRRLARDVSRHSIELQKLKRAEERLYRNLGKLGNNQTASSLRESTSSSRRNLIQVQRNGGDLDQADDHAEDISMYGDKEPHETVMEGVMATIDETNHNSTMQDQRNVRPTEVPRSGQEYHKERITEGDCHLNHGSSYSDALVVQETTSEAKQNLRTILEEKKREIDIKIFDLVVKREELACLRAVQKQERERKQEMELERRRARLRHGQVFRVVHVSMLWI